MKVYHNTSKLDGYALVSAAVGYRTKRWEWSLNADNLLNKKDYFLPGHFSNQVFPGEPINVSTAVRIKY
jgi:outer membrane receptor protein involved in Fe transport